MSEEPTSPASEYIIRPGEDPDRNFVFSSILHTLKDLLPLVAGPDLYVSGQYMLERVFSQPHTLLTACLPDSPDTILGYVLVVHLVHDQLVQDCLVSILVKSAFRNMGIGNALFKALPAVPLSYAFRSASVSAFLVRHAPQVRYNPIALMG